MSVQDLRTVLYFILVVAKTKLIECVYASSFDFNTTNALNIWREKMHTLIRFICYHDLTLNVNKTPGIFAALTYFLMHCEL